MAPGLILTTTFTVIGIQTFGTGTTRQLSATVGTAGILKTKTIQDMRNGTGMGMITGVEMTMETMAADTTGIGMTMGIDKHKESKGG